MLLVYKANIQTFMLSLPWVVAVFFGRPRDWDGGREVTEARIDAPQRP